MDFAVNVEQLDAILQDALTFVVTHVLVLSNLVQVSVIALGYFVARFASGPVGQVVDKALSLPHVQKYRNSLNAVLTPLVLPLLWLVWAGTAQFSALQLGWPSAILDVSVSMLTAWVVIRLVLHFVVDPWWSKAVAVFVWSVAALDILGLLDPTLRFMDGLAINFGTFRLSLLLVVKGIIAIVALLWLANGAARLVELRLKTLKHFTPSQKVLFSKLARVVFITLAILIGINMVGIDLTALTVFSGALGLGIGFGLQKVVGNLMSGVILLMDRSVKPGDVVSIAGTYGWINTIGARYVSVVTRDGIEHLIPNEVLMTTAVENWSHSDNLVRQRLPIGVDYKSDVPKAIELAVKAAGEYERVLKDPPPKCLLMGFGDSAINLELRIWIQDAENGVSNIKSLIYLRIMELYAEHGVAFPFPQRDIHVKGPVRLQMESVENLNEIETPR